MKSSDDAALMSARELAQLLDVPPSILANWRTAMVPTGPRWEKAGRLVRYRRTEVSAWLEGLEGQ